MSYVVLTLVPRLTRRPKPGDSRATGIREEGCHICVIAYTGKLTPCWKHKNDHILWAEKEDDHDPAVVAEKPETPVLHDLSGAEEPVEVS